MVVSTEKPKQIYIFDIRDDIKKGKTLVKYAFRYNIESTIMEHETEQGQIEEIQTPFDVGLRLGGYTVGSTFNPTNALIAAPYYGYNSATWTDDYIREVYEAKIPFTVQNKLSIY